MSDDQPSSGSMLKSDGEGKSAAVTKPSGISTGRIVTWVLIAALAAVTGLEAVAKFGYDGTLVALKALNIEASDAGVELTEIDRNISGWTTRETNANGDVVIRWVSLLKDYEVRLQPEPGQPGHIGSFETPAAAPTELEAPSMPTDIAPGLPPDPSSASIPGGGRAGAPPRPPPPSAKQLQAPPRPDESSPDKKPLDN